jgi:hypothetical protein
MTLTPELKNFISSVSNEVKSIENMHSYYSKLANLTTSVNDDITNFLPNSQKRILETMSFIQEREDILSDEEFEQFKKSLSTFFKVAEEKNDELIDILDDSVKRTHYFVGIGKVSQETYERVVKLMEELGKYGCVSISAKLISRKSNVIKLFNKEEKPQANHNVSISNIKPTPQDKVIVLQSDTHCFYASSQKRYLDAFLEKLKKSDNTLDFVYRTEDVRMLFSYLYVKRKLGATTENFDTYLAETIPNKKEQKKKSTMKP